MKVLQSVLALHAKGSRRGVTLVLAMLVISAVAVMCFSLTLTSLRSKEERRQAHQDLNAVYIAEAGVRLAAMDLVSGRDGNMGSKENPLSYGSGALQVETLAVAGGLTQITATGTENGSSATVQVLIKASASSPYIWAAFGDTSVTMDSNAKVDSYDSSLGPYEDQDTNGSGTKRYALDNGNVGSNQDVLIASNSRIYGDAIPGSGYSTTATGSATISGSTTPAPAPFILEPLVFPSFPSSGALSASGTSSLPSGNYYFSDLKVNGNATLTIVGPAVVVADAMSLSSNAKLMVDASTGPVEFWVYGDFEMNSNTLIASTTYDPADVQVFLDADNVLDPDVVVDVDITFDSNARFFGTISAPNSSIDIDSNFELFGSVIAKQVHLDSNSRIHFDENLLTLGGSGGSSYTMVGWRLIGN